MFLKYPGSKKKRVKEISTYLSGGFRLVDPFVGSGAIFMGTDYEQYLLCDINKDVIDLYKYVQRDVDGLITGLENIFIPENNTAKVYYRFRDKFNNSTDAKYRSILFIWLNQTSYNGLIRYSKRSGFNVPFGNMKNPRINIDHILRFANKSQEKNVTFKHQDFRETFTEINRLDHVTLDPPYSPLEKQKTNFTTYAGNTFSNKDHDELAALAKTSAKAGSKVIVFDHDTADVRKRYRGHELKVTQVTRSISASAIKRNKAPELLIQLK
ncbi:Dam family site-specific DNA-(adenine-N6)-methyltransferase [Thalassotalea marina]|uniref:site-specific DNA-methyltransferase (adenine-specific) n=1 Tax=Thalassotalea marina TaxID=1673741 RepID=A0A919BRN2_9GAMM|nr:Dam family site-specific DNA-(adenine-N6)-methyltransferase [Thalassotalea marina]GHG07026.1 DNA adenine methylase [Thalassotalea marina]